MTKKTDQRNGLYCKHCTLKTEKDENGKVRQVSIECSIYMRPCNRPNDCPKYEEGNNA